MRGTPSARPYKAKVRRLIWERGYTIEGVARKMGCPTATLYSITGRNKPRPVGVESILRPLAAILSTPAERIKVSDISDWPFDDDTEPEPEALASLDANVARPPQTTGPGTIQVQR